MTLAGCVDNFFHISERGSSIKTEFFAGFINFIANAYLLAIVPQILESSGLRREGFQFAFSICTCITSVCVGFFGNLPLPAGPGIGGATFIAYSLVDNFTSSSSDIAPFVYTTIFCAGIVMSFLSLLNIPLILFSWSPTSVKEAMPVGLGALFALIGFRHIQVVTYEAKGGLSMGSLTNISMWLGLSGVFLIAFLTMKGFKGAFIFPIFVVRILHLNLPPFVFLY
jgi:AGZA family xanthine/uracil permease-like MFS transporter